MKANEFTALHLELTRPFDPQKLHWRVGATTSDKSKGIALAYLNARDVMQRLDGVIGVANWQCRYPMTGVCELSLRIGGEWITKTNAAGETDVEAEKGQASDAFKRAAVLFGIGRYLYYLPNNWCALKPAGRSHVLADTPTMPAWALPHNWETYYYDMFDVEPTTQEK